MSDLPEGMSLLGNTLTSGREMWEELEARRNGYKQAAEQPTTTQPDQSEQYKQEIEQLRNQVSQSQRENSELRGHVSQLSSQYAQTQNYIQSQLAQQQKQQQSQANELPALDNFDDPTIQAAVAALDARNQKRHEQTLQYTQSALNSFAYQTEVQRINAALEQVRKERPDFEKSVSNQQIEEVIKPYLSNPNGFGQMNWTKEFTLMANTVEHPILQTKVAELERKLAHYEKQEKRTQREQKENLSKVPSIGQRHSGGDPTTSGMSIGDRILHEHKQVHGRRSLPSWSEFGNRLFQELGKQGGG